VVHTITAQCYHPAAVEIGAPVMQLSGKLVTITGSGRGIGRAIALAFAQRGANLALLDLNESDLDRTQNECEKLGVRARTFLCNVTREDAMIETMDAIIAEFGHLDVMINNAGITKDAMLVKVQEGKPVGKMSLEQWNAVIEVNLTGVFLGAREAVERMIRTGNGGVVINISSISRSGNIGQSNYAAAKAGVASMTVVWAKELARYGIRTGAIAPGFTRTEILDTMKPELIERAISAVPLRRMAEPAEVAHAAVFIAENEYFSGRVIELDGGQRI
jgi:3-oxoacyl-[acyl-carrier protein] reductase